jgi:cell division protein FtsN
MGLLDISGFFTGLIINLLLVTLICYYFKRKYENIEAAQMEQAKLLYELLKNARPVTDSDIKHIELTDDLSESDYSEESDEVDEARELDEAREPDEVDELDEARELDEVRELDEDYNKMSVKSLRDVLSTKGIKTNPKMKKNELIGLVTNKSTLVVDLAFEETLPSVD